MKNKILLTEEQINFVILELRNDLLEFYKNTKELEIIIVLDGAMVFASELLSEKFHLKNNRHFIKVKSYFGTQRSGPKIISYGFDLRNIRNKDVLILDDILDSGETLKVITSLVQKQKPKSLNSCVLLQKIGARTKPIDVKFVGAKFYSNRFVYGFGLDLDGKFRELKDLWVQN